MGERAAKKTQFFSKNFPKTLNDFFGMFFQNFACGVENLTETGSFYWFSRAQKIQLVDLKKCQQYFFENPHFSKTLTQCFCL